MRHCQAQGFARSILCTIEGSNFTSMLDFLFRAGTLMFNNPQQLVAISPLLPPVPLAYILGNDAQRQFRRPI
jgi:hypothetical protein